MTDAGAGQSVHYHYSEFTFRKIEELDAFLDEIGSDLGSIRFCLDWACLEPLSQSPEPEGRK